MERTKLNAKLLVALIIGSITLSSAFSSLTRNVSIKNTGKISTILPLHTEGKYIKDSLNNTVMLKGVWKGAFLDTSTGWWDINASRWNETALRESLYKLRYVWGVNVINVFTWGDWWLENKAKTAGGGSADIGCRDAIVRTVQVAAEYGIYVQVRLYSPSEAEGRREGFPFQPTYNWTVNDFVSFWRNVSLTLKDYPNVIFTLFDEPSAPSGYTMDDYFDAAEQAIAAIRNAGFYGLIAVHWQWCGATNWIEHWVNESRPLYNIVFSTHIYRSEGTFGGNRNSPVDIDYIRNYLATRNVPEGRYPPIGAGYKYILDNYNVPIWVSAIGARYGVTDDSEYVYFWNTLQVLNEWGIGYVAFHCQRTGGDMWTLLKDPVNEVFSEPNRVGQALINAIKGIPPPPTYQLTIDSNIPGVQFTLNGIQKTTPYNATLFAGNYTISIPSTVTTYQHHPLFGKTDIGETGKGYRGELCTAGPYTINDSASIFGIYLYTCKVGKARVAIYNATYYTRPPYPDGWPHPGSLIVQSEEYTCQANTWNLIPISNTTLQPGTYFIAIKIDTNGMLADAIKQWFGQYIYQDYSASFPNSFGTISGGTGTEFSVYVPSALLETNTYYFSYWEDNLSTPRERIINLTSDINLTAIYVLGGS